MKYILLLLFSFTLQAQSLLLLFNDEVDSTTTLPPAVWSQDPTLQTPPLLTVTDLSGNGLTGLFLGGMETAQSGVTVGWAYDGVNDALAIPWTAPTTWTMTATSSENPTLTLQGTGYVTIDWGDSTITTQLLTGTDANISHTYTKSMTRTIKFINSSKLTKFRTGSDLNWSFDLSSLPSEMTTFICSGSNTVTGNLSSLPSKLATFICFGSNTITGDLSSLPSEIKSFTCAGSNTIAGNLSSLPSGLTNFQCSGSNTITGNLSSLPSGVSYFYCTGLNTIADYTSGHTWSNNLNHFYIRQAAGAGLSSTEVDNLLIDMASATWAGASRTLDVRGVNAARTSASDAAVATLEGKSVSVLTN